MSAPTRPELLRRARDAYHAHGRGFTIAHEGREEAHYGLPEELDDALAEESDASGLVAVARTAIEEYDPEREAVLIDSRSDGILVTIVGENGPRTLGRFRWG
jgi:hypothetical protein